MEIGELHTTFLFDNAAEAKTLWERIEQRCRWISAYRWMMPGLDSSVAITLLAEETHDQRVSYERARRILRQGEEIETPPISLMALRGRRQELADRGGRRQRIRVPGGIGVNIDGKLMGPERRPQG